MSDRSKYMSKEFGLNLEQLQVVANMNERDFNIWESRGARKAALDQLIEDAYIRSKTGQTLDNRIPVKASKEIQKASYAAVSAGETHGDLGLDLRPNRAFTKYDESVAEDLLREFAQRYEQLVVSHKNFHKLAEFLKTRQCMVTMHNLEVAYAELFAGGHLSVRDIERRPVAKAPQQSQDGNAGFRHKLFTTAGIPIPKQSKKKNRVPPTINTNSVETEIVETVYSGDDVRRFSADKMAKYLLPMKFSGTDVIANQSASEFLAQSEVLKDKTPPYLLGQRREREIHAFLNSDYGRACKASMERLQIDGDFLTSRIIKYLNDNHLDYHQGTFKEAAIAVLDSISITIDETAGNSVHHGSTTIHTQHGQHDSQLQLGSSLNPSSSFAGQRDPSKAEPSHQYTPQETKRLVRILSADQLLAKLSEDVLFRAAVDKFM